MGRSENDTAKIRQTGMTFYTAQLRTQDLTSTMKSEHLNSVPRLPISLKCEERGLLPFSDPYYLV